MQQTLLTFPCPFRLKIIGLSNEQFEGMVVGILNQYVPDLGENAISTQFSANQKYLSITANINAQSQEQLDAIYRTLSGHPNILMVL
jgi:putative lipoic acid-binding regulatory protein